VESFSKKWAQLLWSPAVRYAGGCGALILLLTVVDVGRVVGALALVSMQDVALILLLGALLVWVSVLKWQLFLRELGNTTGMVRLTKLYLLGYFVNLLVPSYVGGDVARTVAVGKGQDRARAFSATFLERYTGLVAMLLMAFVGLFGAAEVTPAMRLATVVIVFATVVGSAAVFLGYSSKIVRLLRCPERLVAIATRVEDGMRLGVSRKSVLAKAAALSLLFHLLTIVNTGAVGFAVGWTEIPWRDLLVVVPLILLIGAIPISPQGLGIQEGAFVFFLSSVGATEAQGLAIGIILRAKSYLLALIGGLLWLLEKRGTQRAESAQVQP
jgi:uncharacterized protein (TIRG00374 family)